MLHAFFDDIWLQREPATKGVAGFLFDEENLRRFENSWRPRVAGLSKPFRTAACFAGNPPFTMREGWPREDRMRFLGELADLIAETRDAGFTSTVEIGEYENYVAKHREAASVIGGPYTLTLATCMESVLDYVAEQHPGQQVYLWIEKGDPAPEAEARKFLKRSLEAISQPDPSIVKDFDFVSKGAAPALCAADFLAWEWQRNYYDGTQHEMSGGDIGLWRDNFKRLFKDEHSKPIHTAPLWERRLQVRELVNKVTGLDRE